MKTAAASLLSALDADPMASMRMHGAAIADLAFGSLSNTALNISINRHLALLPPDALELDLNDPAQRQFGDYELLEMIGEGGMGVVYRARQASLDREVAVKLLAAGPWASKEFVERFHREAQNAARMQHPNIVAIYEVGSAEELHFFSMRLIHGGSLAAVLKRDGKLPPMRAAQLLRTVAEAVDYAHRLGVLHLDLKPANVLLDDNGNPHVADFGLARRFDSVLAADNFEVSGTPSYMAPEQAIAGAQKITPATDVWGLGAILYELVTGEPPFLAESAQATLKLVVQGTLRNPRRHVPGLPRDLEAIIEKSMAREVAQRYPNPRALADDLGRFIENRPVHARPLKRVQRVWRWANRQPYIAGLGLLFTLSLLAGIIGVTTQWRRAESNAATASERLWESRRDAALQLQLDGKGFAALPTLLANIQEQESAGKNALASADRGEVGTILGQGVTLIDRVLLADPLGSPMAIDISPDGSLLAIAFTNLTVHWFDARTLAELGRVDLLGLPTSTGGPEMPQLLRFIDNHRLRVTLEWPDFEPAPGETDTILIDLDRGRAVPFPEDFPELTNAVFSADGHYALLHNRQREIQFWQVQPWRALSAKVPMNQATEATILGHDGRFAAAIGSAMHTLDIYDPRDMAKPTRVALPPTQGLSAWAENSDGSLMALGDYDGRLFVLDLASRKVRQLATPRGREITWVAFSEDDQWLAAVRWDGAAYAFDVASGDPLISGQMQHEFELHHVSINHRERLLVASGLGKVALWHLPEPGPTAVAATRVMTSPPHTAVAGPYSLAFSQETGLMATAAMDGEIRLWRAPRSPILRAHAAQQIPGMLAFDGRQVVDVEYNKLRIITTAGEALTPWIELPQPPGFAELVDVGRSLVVTTGVELRIFDSATLKLRYPPTKLPANPLRLVASTDGATAVLSFANSSNSGFEEHLQSYALKTGQARGSPVVVNAPLRQLELSFDGSRLLATGSPGATTKVFAADSLKLIGEFQPAQGSGVVWAAFVPASEQIALVTNSLDLRSDGASLVFWNPAEHNYNAAHSLRRVWPVGVAITMTGPFVAGRDKDFLNAGTGSERSFEQQTRSEATAAVAVSHDGLLIAHAFSHKVQIYDIATAAAVGPALPAGINGLDVIAQIAFAPDDHQLLGRTIQGQWLLWQIAPDQRPVNQIRQDAQVLDASMDSASATLPITKAERDALRRHDPGAWRLPEPRPAAPAARFVDGLPIPARAAATSPLMLDLTPFYNLAPDSKGNPMTNVIRVMRVLPYGVLHLSDTDYDVRGAIQLHEMYISDSYKPFQKDVSGIPVPDVPVAAIHILLLATGFSAQAEGMVYAHVHLHYRDGSTASVPLLTQRDVPGGTEQDKPVPLTWVWGDQNRLTGDFYQHVISNPRLPNPHPDRAIATLDFEVEPDMKINDASGANPALFAITVEPVISTDSSGSSSQRESSNPRDVRLHRVTIH